MESKSFKSLLKEQRKQITSHKIYEKLSNRIKHSENAAILERISKEEIDHYNQIKEHTNQDVKFNIFKFLFYYWLSLIFGITFGLKLLERDEQKSCKKCSVLSKTYPFFITIMKDEERQEKQVLNMLNEERLNFIGSIVLGLNDALVELTGALAGYTFAFQNTNIIAVIALITGISASFSMAASEYLSTKQDDIQNALKSSFYTGLAYVFTVVFLVIPYFICSNAFISLGISLITAVCIILIFNYYVSIAKDYNFKKRFIEMTTISLGVAFISFIIGIIVKQVFGINL